MMELYAQGIAQNRKKLTEVLESVAGDMVLPFSGVQAQALPATSAAYGSAASAPVISRGTSIGSITFNIQAREGQSIDQLADEIMERLYNAVDGKKRMYA